MELWQSCAKCRGSFALTCELTDDQSSEWVAFDGRCRRLTHDNDISTIHSVVNNLIIKQREQLSEIRQLASGYSTWLAYNQRDVFSELLHTRVIQRPRTILGISASARRISGKRGGGSYNFAQQPRPIFKGNISVADCMPLSSLL